MGVVFNMLKEWFLGVRENGPRRRLFRVVEMLPREAYCLDGMDYSEGEVREWLHGGEYEWLIGVLAGLGDEYEDQYETCLSEGFWLELEAVAESLGYLSALKQFYEGGVRKRAPSPQAEFLALVRGGHFLGMKDGGSSPLEVAVAAFELGGGDLDVVKLLRGMFEVEFEGAVGIMREAKARV